MSQLRVRSKSASAPFIEL